MKKEEVDGASHMSIQTEDAYYLVLGKWWDG